MSSGGNDIYPKTEAGIAPCLYTKTSLLCADKAISHTKTSMHMRMVTAVTIGVISIGLSSRKERINTPDMKTQIRTNDPEGTQQEGPRQG